MKSQLCRHILGQFFETNYCIKGFFQKGSYTYVAIWFLLQFQQFFASQNFKFPPNYPLITPSHARKFTSKNKAKQKRWEKGRKRRKGKADTRFLGPGRSPPHKETGDLPATGIDSPLFASNNVWSSGVSLHNRCLWANEDEANGNAASFLRHCGTKLRIGREDRDQHFLSVTVLPTWRDAHLRRVRKGNGGWLISVNAEFFYKYKINGDFLKPNYLFKI